VSKVTVDAHNNLVLTLREPVNGSDVVTRSSTPSSCSTMNSTNLLVQQYRMGIWTITTTPRTPRPRRGCPLCPIWPSCLFA
jgi:cell division protease FtsH